MEDETPQRSAAKRSRKEEARDLILKKGGMFIHGEGSGENKRVYSSHLSNIQCINYGHVTAMLNNPQQT